jgi:hypothetical protein
MTQTIHDLNWPKGGDPVSQASLWVGPRLYPWQCKVLEKIMRGGARLAVVTPNESGKTSTVIPAAGLSFMAAFPGAQVVSTSGVERQIKEQLWPVLRASLSRYPRWQITEELKIKAPAVRGLPGSTWEAFTTKDPDYAEGFHGRTFKDETGRLVYCPLMIVIDEAKSISQAMFDAFMRCDPDVWLTISTSGEDTGPFFDCFHVNKNDPWDTVEVTWTDCPHLRVGRKLEDRQRLIRKRGENDPFVMSYVFGKFFRKGGRNVFERTADIEFAMTGEPALVRGVRKAALDFSGGGDEQIFTVRDGNAQKELRAYHETDTTILGDKFLADLARWEVAPENTIADNGGLGKPIIDYMERRGFKPIRRYMSDEAPHDPEHYVNKIAEDHFELRLRLEMRGAKLINDAVLKDQMSRRQYLMKNDDSNRIRVEPKEHVRNRGEKSPDRLDATVMLFSDMPPVEDERDTEAPRTGDYRKCFASDEEETGRWAGTYFQR